MIIHQFNDSRFPQSYQDQTIAGLIIPKGYVNASEMCKTWGKEVRVFMQQKSTKLFVEALDKDINKGKSGNLTYQDTRDNTGESTETNHKWLTSVISLGSKTTPNLSPAYRGVWVHPELAIELAGWLSVDFKLWANRVLRLVLEGHINTLSFSEAQRNLQWEYLRAQGKVSRRKFTDCLKDYLIREFGEDFYNSPASAPLFAKYTAIAQYKITGMAHFNGNRDNCTQEQLETLEKFEHKFEVMYETMYPELSFAAILGKVLARY